VKTAAISFLASAATSAALTPVVRDLAIRRGWLDPVSSRKVHGRPVPRVGGMAIVVAFYVPLLLLLFVDSSVGDRFWSSPGRAIGLLVGGLAIAALGVWDDLRGANARTKFAVQFAAAGLVYALGYRIDLVDLPFGGEIALGPLGLPFTMLWIAGVINALNLIDGLDGLAGGVAMTVLAALFALAAWNDAPLMLLFVAALGGAVLGFLVFNVNPASVFMGDTGSMFIGFVLATTAIRVSHGPSPHVHLAIPIVALGVPIADTLLAMGRRAARGAPLFSADRGHLHHRLLALGLTHKQAVLVLWTASGLLAVAALALDSASAGVSVLVLMGVAGLISLALHGLGYLRMPDPAVLLLRRRRNLAMQRSMRRVADRLRAAHTPGHVWAATRLAARVVGARSVALEFPPTLGGEAARIHGFGRGVLLVARYDLPSPAGGSLRLGWSDGRDEVDRDTEIAIELLCERLSEAVERTVTELAGRRARALRLVG
jgi:UDP-GlcNAc:undecaprenyl-phosphate GlcNAc-1-phosphate transferase